MTDSFTFENAGEPTTAALPPVPSQRLAGFWIRFVAMFIDGVILVIPSVLINVVLPYAGGIILSILYKVFFESSRLQGTPGKALMGLRVTNLQGHRITLRESFIRYAASILSSLVMFIGYIMAAFTEKKQALHDIIANTLVVFEPPPANINYLEVWINEIQAGFGYNSEGPRERRPENMARTSAGPTASATKQLEELHSLYTRGIINETEFNQKKEELLKRF